MADRPTLIVAGLGRCGTSLAMNMLCAAGLPVVGKAPGFECAEAQTLLERLPDQWAERVRGRAVKVLDAHRWQIPHLGEYDLLWLARDPAQQARSMVKLMMATGQPVQPNRGTLRALAKSIRQDTPRAIRRLQRAGTQRAGIAIVFEDIIEHPRRTAATICEAFGIDEARAPAMAAQVRDRDTHCLPVLAEAFHG